jgi:hypothetical protein
VLLVRRAGEGLHRSSRADAISPSGTGPAPYDRIGRNTPPAQTGTNDPAGTFDPARTIEPD